MLEMEDRAAVVTGASSGIGRAIALGLGRMGCRLCLLGRRKKVLDAVGEELQPVAASVQSYELDLTSSDEIERVADSIVNEHGHVDVLVHSAGSIRRGYVADARLAEFDEQYSVNVRAPYLLTQRLLGSIKAGRGQVVFINSTAGLQAGKDAAQYSASKHALKAIADSLRAEVNAEGIRVLSVYPGRTATPMQAQVFAMEGRVYRPEQLMQPEDVAEIVIAALRLPRSAEVTDITIRPMQKAS